MKKKGADTPAPYGSSFRHVPLCQPVRAVTPLLPRRAWLFSDTVQPRYSQNRTIMLITAPPLFCSYSCALLMRRSARLCVQARPCSRAAHGCFLTQFSRAIRKTALSCLLRLRRCFAHILALSSCAAPLACACRHAPAPAPRMAVF